MDEQDCFGYLTGFKDADDNVYCTAISRSLDYGSLNMVGAYDTRRCQEEDELIENAMNKIDKKNGQYHLIYFGTDGALKVCLIDLKEGAYEDCDLESIESDKYLNSCLTINITGGLIYKMIYDKEKEKFEANLKAENDNQMKSLRKVPIKLVDSEFKIQNFSTSDASSISDIYSHLKEDELEQLKSMPGSKAQKEKMKLQIIKQWINEKKKILFKFNSELEISDDKEFYEIDEASNSVDIDMNVHFTFVLNQLITIKVFSKLIENAFQRTLNQIKSNLIENHKEDRKECRISKPMFYNFLPFDYSASVLHIIYLKHLKDDDLVEKRKQLCNLLNLTIDRPLIRRSNALRSKPYYNSILANVHSGLLQNLKGTVRTVKGTYSYFHYMQHNFNDNGWGCAYRSLQTLISWFDHQGYINIDKIPSHRDIQQVLIDIEDKRPSFLNSKGWIGSQEVGYVLNTLYGIQFKILFVNSGTELANKGRELCSHFEKQGTPIMIGGNNLAHTILGVEFNENTGSLKFLVLDPHYTGAEDLKTIINKVKKRIHFKNFIIIKKKKF